MHRSSAQTRPVRLRSPWMSAGAIRSKPRRIPARRQRRPRPGILTSRFSTWVFLNRREIEQKQSPNGDRESLPASLNLPRDPTREWTGEDPNSTTDDWAGFRTGPDIAIASPRNAPETPQRDPCDRQVRFARILDCGWSTRVVESMGMTTSSERRPAYANRVSPSASCRCRLTLASEAGDRKRRNRQTRGDFIERITQCAVLAHRARRPLPANLAIRALRPRSRAACRPISSAGRESRGHGLPLESCGGDGDSPEFRVVRVTATSPARVILVCAEKMKSHLACVPVRRQRANCNP